MSSENSPQAIAHMLRASKCRFVLVQLLTMDLIEQVKDELRPEGIDLRVDTVPTLHDLYPQLSESGVRSTSPPPPYPEQRSGMNLNDMAMY